MNLTRFLCFALVLALSIALHAEESLSLHCGALLDPETDTVSRDVFVIIEGSAVQQILPAGAASQIPAGAKAIDLSKAFCLPGLIDVHDHLTSDPSDSGYQSLGSLVR